MKKFYSVVTAASFVALSAVSAFAVPLLDFSSATTAITGELGPAITSAMPILGAILAVGIGYKLYKRLAK